MLKLVGRGRKRTITLKGVKDKQLAARFLKRNTWSGYVPIFEGYFKSSAGNTLECDGLKFRIADDNVSKLVQMLVSGDIEVTPQGIKLQLSPIKAVNSTWRPQAHWELAELEEEVDHDPEVLEFWRQFCNL